MNQSTVLPATKTDRILVVDDLPDNCFLIQTLLQEEGYDIEVVNSGMAALDYIEQSPPDLVLLDVMMPGMDGYEVTRRIRQNAALPFMPILLITAHEQASVVQGLDLGADEFIRKPIEVNELVARVRSMLRLKHSVDERDQIARQREDFVSRLTHDLRTPLVAADRMLTLFHQGSLGDLSPAMEEAVAIMLRSNQNLLTMVNMLLEVYRYDAGRKKLSFAPVKLVELVQEVLEELRPLAIEKGLALSFDDSEAKDGAVLGDRLELRRVITNLIGNAIKFTTAGSVRVRLQPSAPSQMTLDIEDTGPGIAAEELPTLFESFVQGNHKRGGSGLGLQLSRRIVEAHRGTIDVQTEVGKGSRFSVQLPTP
ncbi:hybrid sensor histidine kinase/response regulator [Leptolyngbya sp. FACHB-36]|uniref:hybrid sensor histidine kinase/response regulator n=1 Tax=Leptolyngbya sp. FACHB-36 TaxID=2692808 RepID=UPI001681C1AA|nr:hybrid sensor histidine kinase/response regulator [Leptolyngbya sp. FACHB-36]MBD2022601.1 hybrid sensor histidine kinase/response regulator [Leptolyngbya sp. FACHB-36]